MYFQISVIFLIFVVLISNISAVENVSVTISENSYIVGKNIYLGDIAHIESSNEKLRQEIAKLVISPSAEPGMSILLHIGYIKSRIRNQGIDPDSIIWKGSDSTKVQTKAITISAPEIVSSALDFIVNATGVPKEQTKIEPIVDIKPIILPYGKPEIKVEPISHTPTKGTIPLRFLILIDGKECERRNIPFKCQIIKEVIVATKEIDINKNIEIDDLSLTACDIGINSEYYTEKTKIIGKRAKRLIAPGTIITSDMFDDFPIIKQGDLVTIVIESTKFRITAQGKAKEDGKIGQLIKVANTTTMKEIIARVLDNKTVQVDF